MFLRTLICGLAFAATSAFAADIIPTNGTYNPADTTDYCAFSLQAVTDGSGNLTGLNVTVTDSNCGGGTASLTCASDTCTYSDGTAADGFTMTVQSTTTVAYSDASGDATTYTYSSSSPVVRLKK